MIARTCLAVSLALAAQVCGNPVEKLGWMSGCWTLAAGALTIDEHWSKPAAGNLLGWSRTVKDGKLNFHE